MKSIPAATEEEVEATVKVMGGEDWKLWMQALKMQMCYQKMQVLSHILISDLNLRINLF